MIIILEGIDKTGKSTIGKALSDKIKIPYFKNPSEKEHFKDEVAWWRWLDQLYIYEFLKQTKYSVIIDRGHPSDYVYSKVFRAASQAYVKRILFIDSLFAELNARIIYCYNDDTKNKDELFDLKRYHGWLKREYEYFLGHSKCKVMYLDTGGNNIEEQLEAILWWLRIMEKEKKGE